MKETTRTEKMLQKADARKPRGASSTEDLLNVIRGKIPTAPSPGMDTGEGASLMGPRKSSASLPERLLGLDVRRVLGIEIEPGEARLFKAEAHGGEWKMLDFRATQFDPALDIESPDFTRILKESVAEIGGAKGKIEVWTVIPQQNVTVWELTVPRVAKSQMDNAIIWAARKSRKFDENEEIFDYKIVGAFEEECVEKLRVMAYTAPKQAVRQITDVFRRAGLTVGGVTTSAFAFQNLLRNGWVETRPGETLALLTIGQTKTRIDIFHDGRFAYSRGIISGVNAMVESIAQQAKPVKSAHDEPEGRGGESAFASAAPLVTTEIDGQPHSSELGELGELGDSGGGGFIRAEDLGRSGRYGTLEDDEPVRSQTKPAVAETAGPPADVEGDLEPGPALSGLRAHGEAGSENVIGEDEARRLLRLLTPDATLQGDDPEGAEGMTAEDVLAMVMPATNRLIRQIEMTFEHHQRMLGDGTIHRLLVAGEVCQYPPILEQIGRRVGFPTGPISQSALARERAMQLDLDAFASMPSAAGLALSGNLQTPNFLFTYAERAEAGRVASINHYMLLGLAALNVISFGAFLFLKFSAGHEESRLATLKGRLAAYQPVVDETRMNAATEEFKQLKTAQSEYADRFMGVVAVGDVIRLTPEVIRLMHVTMEQPAPPPGQTAASPPPPPSAGQPGAAQKVRPARRLVIEGVVTGPPDQHETVLSNYFVLLKTSPIISEVGTVKSGVERMGGVGEVLKFTLNVALRQER